MIWWNMDTYKNCLVCGQLFKVCNTCRKDTDEMFQWRRVVCCPEHFRYHIPIIQYVRGKIDRETAKKDLQSAIEQYGNIDFCENVRDIVTKILGNTSAESDIPTKRKKKRK